MIAQVPLTDIKLTGGIVCNICRAARDREFCEALRADAARHHPDPKVEGMRQSLRRGETLPPISLTTDYFINDGTHRIAAYIMEGWTQIPCCGDFAPESVQ